MSTHCQNKSVDFTDKTFYKKVGIVLSNAKDWDGFGQVRKKKVAKPAELEQTVENE